MTCKIESLRTKFDRLSNKKKKTGYLYCPPQVLRANHAARVIIGKVNSVSVGSSVVGGERCEGVGNVRADDGDSNGKFGARKRKRRI